MLYGTLNFSEIPQIGFAHHFKAEKYSFTYSSQKKSFEIVYVTSGGITAVIDNETIIAPEGSIFVLFRHIPIKISSLEGIPNEHCTVQAEFNYDFTMTNDISEIKSNRLVLPFVTFPSTETEEIKKDLFSIVTDMSTSRDDNALSCSLKFLSIMQRIDKIAHSSKDFSTQQASLIIYKIKNYIASKVSESFSLSDVSTSLGLSESYLNHIFKENVGLPIKQYAARVKTNRIAELMSTHQVDFATACANVGINDVCYGYRIFKKHIGVTPNQYAQKIKILEK